jgi:hypothetical protein
MSDSLDFNVEYIVTNFRENYLIRLKLSNVPDMEALFGASLPAYLEASLFQKELERDEGNDYVSFLETKLEKIKVTKSPFLENYSVTMVDYPLNSDQPVSDQPVSDQPVTDYVLVCDESNNPPLDNSPTLSLKTYSNIFKGL